MTRMYADTNTIVRLLAKDDEDQKRHIINAIAENKVSLVISDTVAIECCWTLKHHYGLTNNVIGQAISNLAEVENITFESNDIMRTTLLQFSKQGNVDIVDVHLSVLSLLNTTPVLTYDRDFKKLSCEYYRPDQII